MKFLKLGLLSFLGAGLVACSDNSNQQQGYIEGRYTYASSYTAGYLDHLQVQRGQAVKEGTPLFVLNKNPEVDNWLQAKANARAEKQT
jgi:HlyD family secretion protein